MNYQDRLKEADRLERENHAILSTPLMSEGNISPMQVGMFSPRQKARWQTAAMIKMDLQVKIKLLRATDAEIAECKQRKENKERDSRINQLQRHINDIHGLGRMSHRENGQLKPSYQRELDMAQQELSKL